MNITSSLPVDANVFRKWLKLSAALKLSSAWFVVGYSAVFGVLFNIPVIRFVLSDFQGNPILGAHVVAVWMSVVYLFISIILYLLSLISIRALKIVSSAFILLNSLAIYFMTTYNVVLDKTMIGNIFNTSVKESSQFLHPNLFFAFLMLGVIPTVLVFNANIKKSTLTDTAFHLSATLIGIIFWVYLSSGTWRWIDDNASRLGGLTLPSSYIVNSVRFYSDVSKKNETRVALPLGTFKDNDKRIVILVIGESARADNFEIYGYSRPTTPKLSKLDVTAITDAQSCTTYTTGSLECILSHDIPRGLRTPYETLPQYLFRNGAEVIWRTNNWGEPSMTVSQYEKAAKLRKNCETECDYDGALLSGLQDQIRNSEQNKIFIVLHQSGSHGPAYHTKYPKAFEKFTPVCDSVSPGECSNEKIVNAYDNTILYTDHLLSETIGILKAFPDIASTMIYISDHGESLGENNLYLHGTPYAFAPSEQKNIPYIIWSSYKFNREFQISVNTLPTKQSQQYSIFHSVITALNLESSILDKNRSIFKKQKESHSL